MLDRRRAEIIAEAVNLYDALIVRLADDRMPLQLPDHRTAVELAFDLHEAARARSFAASLADARLPVPAGVPDELAAAEQRLLAQERALQGHLVREAPGEPGSRVNRLRDVRAELDDVWHRMGPYAGDYVRLREGEPLRLPEIAHVLAGADPVSAPVLISYYCTADITYCFVVHPTGQIRQYTSTVDRDELWAAARRLGAAFNGDRNAFPSTRPIRRESPYARSIEFFTDLAPRLIPFADELPEGTPTPVWVVPHGPLHLLPIHALPTGDGIPIGFRHPFAYGPSGSALAYLVRRRASAGETLTAFAAGVAAAEDAHPDHFERNEDLFPSTWSVQTATGVAASRSAGLSGVRDRDIVHLSCHGHFDKRDPTRSGLLFSDGQKRHSSEPPADRGHRTQFGTSVRSDPAGPSMGDRVRVCHVGLMAG